MNLRQPFEQSIARKLRQLPAPDADASWQQMKRLLDENEDRGGGGKRPPGNGQWWRIGMIAFVLLCSAWLFIEKNGQQDHLAEVKRPSPASPQTGTNNNSNNSDNHQTGTIDNNTTLTVKKEKNTIGNGLQAEAAANNLPVHNSSTAAAGTENNPLAATETNAVPVNLTVKGSGVSASTIASGSKNGYNKQSAAAHTAVAAADKPGTLSATSSTNNVALADKKTNSSRFSLSPAGRQQQNRIKLYGNNAAAGKEISNEAANAATHYTAVNSRNKKTDKLRNPLLKTAAQTSAGKDITSTQQDNSSALIVANQPVSQKQKTWFERLSALKTNPETPSFDAALAAGDSMATERETSHLLNTETRKAVARAQRDQAFEAADRKERKQLHLNLSNLFKPFSLQLDTDPWWAAGLSLNSGVSLNSQNRFNYNVNAKKGVLLDYIPSPYLQFHLNNYVYVQTELNLITPQYTPQLLIYRSNSEIAAQAGMSQQKSIYIQKMYYFNWPLSLHYSPISNLYFSGGIQFSSFQSGLASIEEKQYNTLTGADHPSSVYTNTLKFKDDSIAAKIAPNEWRWQVGAEYYWNRFSVGLRYNQSFKNAINTTVSPLLPPTVSRNQSMFLFVRYNLFESRRQNTLPKNQ